MKNKTNKILVVGDIHLRSEMAYSDILEDRRVPEKKEILDFIVESAKDCNKVVMLGDLFHNRTNSSELIREMVEFLERFEGKELFILGGNHDKTSSGRTTLDFLSEIKNHSWHVVTDKLIIIGDFDFLPYLIKPELKEKDYKKASKKLLEEMKGNKILFTHFAISGSETSSGAMSDLFDEVVLDRKELEKKYKLIIAGHIHQYNKLSKKTTVTGSIFCNEIGEHEKFIHKIDEETLEVERLKLPGRGIYKLTDPKEDEIAKIPKNSIVKVFITKKEVDLEKIKKELEKFDGSLIIENLPSERKKMQYADEDILGMEMEGLLDLYSKVKKVSLEKLKAGWDLIKN